MSKDKWDAVTDWTASIRSIAKEAGRKRDAVIAQKKARGVRANKVGGLIGEANPSHKLTPNKVMQIRHDYAAGDCSYRILGEEHGVSAMAIRDIIKRVTWKEVK